MSRTLDANVGTLMKTAVRNPIYRVKSEADLLAFTESSIANANAAVAGHPVSAHLRDSNTLDVAYRTASGLRFVVIDLLDGAVDSSDAVTTECKCATVRGGYAYYANWTDSTHLELRRWDFAARTSSQIVNLSHTHGSNLIDAVGYTANGWVIAIGMVDTGIYTQKYLLWISGSSFDTLDNHTQWAIPTGDTTYLWASHVSAIDVGDKIIVYYNDSLSGRAMQFSWRSGIESQPQPCVPLDSDVDVVSFMPNGISKSNNVYYLSGVFTRKMSDSSSLALTVYLTSSDGWHWSVGERNHFIDNESHPGMMAGRPNSASRVVFASTTGANFNIWSAAARPQDGYGSATTITDNVIGFQYSSQLNAADGMDIDLGSPLTINDLITLDAGFHSTQDYLMQIGVLQVDGSQRTDDAGRGSSMQAFLMDLGGRRLKDWRSPVDVDWWSRLAHEDSLDNLGQLLPQTAIRDALVKATTTTNSLKETRTIDSWLQINGLNDPLVAYSSMADTRDGSVWARVKFATTSLYCLSNFGFVFGAKDRNFNAVVFPKESSWTGAPTTPQIVKANLLPDNDDTGYGGFQLEPRMHAILKSNLATSGTVITTAITTTETRPTTTMEVSNGGEYAFLLRKQGRKVQVFGKPADFTPANIETYAAWNFMGEFKFGGLARSKWADNWRFGIIAGTDVWVRKDAYPEAAYGDQALTISEAGDSTTFATTYPDNYLHEVFTNQDPGTSVDTTDNGAIQDGMYVRVECRDTYGNNPHEAWNFFIGVQHNYPVLGQMRLTAPQAIWGHGSSEWRKYPIYSIAESHGRWGYVDCSYRTRQTAGTGETVQIDSGAIKKSQTMGGRAFLVNNDNTAAAPRHVVFDGEWADVVEGSPVSLACWESTSPWGNSTPWRMLFHHGRVLEGDITDDGITAPCYLKIDDEIIRVVVTGLKYPGYSHNHNLEWTEIPTHYAPLATRAANSDTITQWSYNGNYPGGHFDDISNPAGLLVEIQTKSSVGEIPIDANAEKYYVESVSGVDQIVLDKVYKPSIKGQTAGTDGGDIAIISGRAQLGTTKGLHASDSPVVFYPAAFPATTQLDPLIEVERWDHYNGLYLSAEDVIRDVCTMAGVRSIEFNSLGSYSGTLGTSEQTLHSSLTNFVLEFNGHIYSDGQTRWLQVRFRGGYFLLEIQHDITGYSTTGSLGNLEIRLRAPGRSGDLPGPLYLLDQISIPISPADISGTYTTSHTEVESKTINLRVIAHENRITVEAEGQNVHTFNLEAYEYEVEGTGSANYSYTAPGSVTIAYSSSGSAQAVTARLQELSAEVENTILEMGSSASDALSQILNDRHIMFRSTATGGIEFSQFWTRDDAGDYNENLYTDITTRNTSDQVGHMVMAGAEFGEYVDATWIRTNGYIFGMGNNPLLNTVQDSQGEAQLVLRLGKEQTLRKSILSGAYPHLQPGDRLDVSYSGGGSIPAQTSKGFVVGNVLMSGRYGSFDMRTELFEEQ